MNHLSLSFVLAGEGGNGLAQLLDVGQSSTLWTVLIFVLSLPLMWKFVFGPITKALEAREDQAREAAAAAEEARSEIERMKAGIKEDLENARREAAEQVNAAKARAAEREKELLSAAKEEAAKERARAKAEIEQSLVSAREVLRQDAVRLGIDVAQQVISREFSSSDQDRLVGDFQKQIEN
ncbi:MAG: F0F1 ATP synthase subunit B [Planctomycetota bacterium]|jgi:F-type H+-transporting ATPase subunit b|nr:F0F1 ATP synthase subunit B [Planctomycetota bacterium]